MDNYYFIIETIGIIIYVCIVVGYSITPLK
jgi:hypothetical protein